MPQTEIDRIRALLVAKARPVGWAERRARIEEIGAHWPPAPDIALETAQFGDGLVGEFSLAPGADASRVLMFFHGGGYCSGSIVSHRRMVTEAGRAAGVRTFAVQYRLAPEHKFPAAYDDALAAWRFLRAQGYAPEHIIVGGDSAGGGLTAALACRLRDMGEGVPACLWLVSPWTDLTMSGATLVTKDAVDPLIHTPYLEELAQALLPENFDRRDPRISPLYADLPGLPPVLIQVGSAEGLMSDATRMAEALGVADVVTELEIWPHMIHAFPMWNAGLTDGRRALQNLGRFVRERATV